MRRVLVFFSLLLIGAGLLIVAPLAMARWHHVATRAEIKDVFLQPVGDQQARLQVALEFTVPEDGKKISYSSFGNNFADDRLRAISDPVLPLAEAQAYAHRLLGDDPNLRSTCTVFYPPADPADARMIANLAGGPSHVYEFGLGMLACGIMSMMLARRSPRSDP